MKTSRNTRAGRPGVVTVWLSLSLCTWLLGACSEDSGTGSSEFPTGAAPVRSVPTMPTAPSAATSAPMTPGAGATPPAAPVFAPNVAGGDVEAAAPSDMGGTPVGMMAGMMPGDDMLGMAGAGGEMIPPVVPMPPMPDTEMMPPEVEPEPPMMREDLGEGDGSDVVTIGDSWMSAFTTGIQQELARASSQPYRLYGVPGTRLLSEQIPNQYAMAKREDSDIKTVVMTGGGNDIIQVPGLREDCDAGGELCGEEVGKILDRLSALWEEMATDGVQDVIYVQYSDPEGNDVDFALPDGGSVVTRCEAVPEPLRCHTLETNAIVMQDIPDGIHPSAAGYRRIGEAVYDLMVERGMRR